MNRLLRIRLVTVSYEADLIRVRLRIHWISKLFIKFKEKLINNFLEYFSALISKSRLLNWNHLFFCVDLEKSLYFASTDDGIYYILFHFISISSLDQIHEHLSFRLFYKQICLILFMISAYSKKAHPG